MNIVIRAHRAHSLNDFRDIKLALLDLGYTVTLNRHGDLEANHRDTPDPRNLMTADDLKKIVPISHRPANTWPVGRRTSSGAR